MTKCNKVTKDQVFECICRQALDPVCNHFGVTFIKAVAYSLKTSRYQAAKYVHQLIDEGLVEKEVINLNYMLEELVPPIKGITPTEKSEDNEIRKMVEAEIEKSMRECFGGENGEN